MVVTLLFPFQYPIFLVDRSNAGSTTGSNPLVFDLLDVFLCFPSIEGKRSVEYFSIRGMMYNASLMRDLIDA